MKLDEIINNYETRLIDKNDNKWDVIETSDLAEICQEYHKQQLILNGVVASKRFTETDLLRAYKAGCIENHEGVPITSMEDFGEISKNALEWVKRYTE